MSALSKPRSKSTFLKIFKDLKLSPEARDALADIAVEFDLTTLEVVKEVREEVLATLLLVEKEFLLHDEEYHHLTSPKVLEAVRKCLTALGHVPPKGVTK